MLTMARLSTNDQPTQTGTSSSDPDGNDDIASFTFNVLDANKAVVVSKAAGTLGKASLSQASDGLKTNTIYTLQLVVADKAGNIGTASTTLTVGNAKPVPVIKFVPAASVGCGGSVTLDATASTDDGVISTYAWKLVSGASSVTKSGATAAVSQTTDKLTSGAVYNVTLTVTDDKGASASAVSTLKVAAGCVVNTPPVCTNAKPNVTRISTLVSVGLPGWPCQLASLLLPVSHSVPVPARLPRALLNCL
jgi:hypothetical protein